MFGGLLHLSVLRREGILHEHYIYRILNKKKVWKRRQWQPLAQKLTRWYDIVLVGKPNHSGVSNAWMTWNTYFSSRRSYVGYLHCLVFSVRNDLCFWRIPRKSLNNIFVVRTSLIFKFTKHFVGFKIHYFYMISSSCCEKVFRIFVEFDQLNRFYIFIISFFGWR